jgi:VIT1/CCC1 family predicted Fe2+/Mn2+ transporter
MDMLRKIVSIVFTIATTLMARAATSWGCSVCLTGGSDAAIDGYNASVLFLMATPYLVVGSIVGGLIFTYRRALKRSKAAEEEEAIVQLTWNQEDSGR